MPPTTPLRRRAKLHDRMPRPIHTRGKPFDKPWNRNDLFVICKRSARNLRVLNEHTKRLPRGQQANGDMREWLQAGDSDVEVDDMWQNE